MRSLARFTVRLLLFFVMFAAILYCFSGIDTIAKAIGGTTPTYHYYQNSY